jgi:hypothetical protein
LPTIYCSRLPICLASRREAIAPAFLFRAGCEFAALIAIFAYRRLPHGKPMDIG